MTVHNATTVINQELLHQSEMHLLDMLARGAAIPDLERYANSVLENPLMITDESFSLLAYTKNLEVSDPVWTEIIHHQYSPPQLVDQTDVNDFWARLELSDSPLFVDDAAFQTTTRRVVARICIGAKTKGYIALLEYNREIGDSDLLFLQMFAKVLGVKINEENAISIAVGHMRDEFAKEILTGSLQSEKVVVERARTMKLSFKRWKMAMMVFPEEEQAYIGQFLDEVCALFKRYVPFCIYTFDGNAAYYIVSFSKLDTRGKFMDDVVEMFMKKHKLACMVSRPVENVTDIANGFQEVQRMESVFGLIHSSYSAANGAKLHSSVLSYEYLVPYVMVFQLAAMPEADAYRCSALERLKEVDAQDKSCYVETLRSFFRCNQNVSETAKELFLHRNTVNYRLNRIRDLLEEDFDDHGIRLHLQLAIMMEDLNIRFNIRKDSPI